MIPFYAVIRRLRHIKRWQLMRQNDEENVAEHSFEVAILAHALAIIRRDILQLPCPDPSAVLEVALFHDVSECLTGDLPTPVKYYNQELQDAYQALEKQAEQRLIRLLPAELQATYQEALQPEDPELCRLVKLADTLSAYLKAREEVASGNVEFKSAEKNLWDKLEARQSPELDYFLRECLPAYSRSLDELSREAEINF